MPPYTRRWIWRHCHRHNKSLLHIQETWNQFRSCVLVSLFTFFSLASRFSAVSRPATSLTSCSWRATWPSPAWIRRTQLAPARSWRRFAVSWSSFLFSSCPSRTYFLPLAPRRPWCPWRSGPEADGEAHVCIHVFVEDLQVDLLWCLFGGSSSWNLLHTCYNISIYTTYQISDSSNVNMCCSCSRLVVACSSTLKHVAHLFTCVP